MNNKLALTIISNYSSKSFYDKYFWINIWKQVYKQEFPVHIVDSSYMNCPLASLDYQRAKNILLDNAISYIAQKLEKIN